MRYTDLIDQFPEDFQAPIATLLHRLEEGAADAVTRTDFFRLEALIERQSEHIAELAEAQKRTEWRLDFLAQTQAKTDERLDRLTEAMTGLAEAQKRTEQRVEELAQAQAKTDERLDRLTEAMTGLAEAQARTEMRMDDLAAAQLRTEQALASLTERVDTLTVEVRSIRKDLNTTREEMGGLAHTVGHRLEDEAMRSLPVLLARDHGIVVQGRMRRDYMEIAPGRLIEINMWGTGVKGDQTVEIIGEAKSRLAKGHVDHFLEDVERIQEQIGRDVAPVMVAYITTPDVRGYMQEKGVLYYASYEL